MGLKKIVSFTLTMGAILIAGSFTTVSAKITPAGYVKSMKVSEATVNLESGANRIIKATVRIKGNSGKKVKVTVEKDGRKVLKVKVGKPNKKGVSKIELTAKEVAEKKTVELDIRTAGANKKGKAIVKTVKVIVTPKMTQATTSDIPPVQSPETGTTTGDIPPVQSPETGTTTGDTSPVQSPESSTTAGDTTDFYTDIACVIPEQILHQYKYQYEYGDKYEDAQCIDFKETWVYDNYLMFIFGAKASMEKDRISCFVNNEKVESLEYAWARDAKYTYVICKCEQAENVTEVWFDDWQICNISDPTPRVLNVACN